jgi:hypothetical protein
MAGFEPAPPAQVVAPLVKNFMSEPAPPPRASLPAPELRTASAAPVNHAISIGTASGDPDQMLLRALLGVADRLDADRVVQLTAQLPGVLAAVSVKGGTSIAHGGHDRSSQDFQSQAAEIARSMRSLASLIGIEGAETLSITSGERLITFAFTEATAFGVLHADREPASGLRDKLTLIGRELATLLADAKA